MTSFRAILTLLLITRVTVGSVYGQQGQPNFELLEKAALDELRESECTRRGTAGLIDGDLRSIFLSL